MNVDRRTGLNAVALGALCLGCIFPLVWRVKPAAAHVGSGTTTIPLSELLPQAMSGWRVRDLPLGDTERFRAEVRRNLNYTDYVFRRFEREGLHFEVYVARWERGAIPVRMLSAHSPDNCWTNSGWRCLQRGFRQELSVDGRRLLPAEWRQFSPPAGDTLQVWYWHLVEGRLYDFGARFNQTPDPIKRMGDLLEELRRGDPSQIVVRISANAGYDQLCAEPCFREVVKRLEAVRLFRQ